MSGQTTNSCDDANSDDESAVSAWRLSIYKKFQAANKLFEKRKDSNCTEIEDYMVVVDSYKEIIMQLEDQVCHHQNTNLVRIKAQAYSRIGSIFYNLLNNHEKSRLYFNKCITIGRTVAFYESWYVEAEQMLEKFQKNTNTGSNQWETFEDTPNENYNRTTQDRNFQSKAFQNSNSDTAENNTGSDGGTDYKPIEVKLAEAESQFGHMLGNSKVEESDALALIDVYKEILCSADGSDYNIIAKTTSRIGMIYYQILNRVNEAKNYFTKCCNIMKSHCNPSNTKEDWYQNAVSLLNKIKQEDLGTNTHYEFKDEFTYATKDDRKEKASFPDKENINDINQDKTPSQSSSNYNYSSSDREGTSGLFNFMNNIGNKMESMFTDEDLFDKDNHMNQVKFKFDAADKQLDKIVKSTGRPSDAEARDLICTYQEIITSVDSCNTLLIARAKSKIGTVYYRVLRDKQNAEIFYSECLALTNDDVKMKYLATDWLDEACKGLDEIKILRRKEKETRNNREEQSSDDKRNSSYWFGNQWYPTFDSATTMSERVFGAKLKFNVAEEKLKSALKSDSTADTLVCQLKKTFQEIVMAMIYNEDNLRAKSFCLLAKMAYFLEKNQKDAKVYCKNCIETAGSSYALEGWYQDAENLLRKISGSDRPKSNVNNNQDRFFNQSNSQTNPSNSQTNPSDSQTNHPKSNFYDQNKFDKQRQQYEKQIELQIIRNKFEACDQSLNILIGTDDDSATRDFKALILIDRFKEIAYSLDDSQLDLKAKANSKIGYVYYYIIKNKEKAKLYCQSCLNIVSIESRQESWCKQAIDILGKIELQLKRENSRRYNEDITAIENKLLNDEKHLKEVAGSTSSLLRLIYDRFPPRRNSDKNYRLPSLIDYNSEKRLLNRAIVHYHPDRNSKGDYGLMWNKQCEMITRYLSERRKNLETVWVKFD